MATRTASKGAREIARKLEQQASLRNFTETAANLIDAELADFFGYLDHHAACALAHGGYACTCGLAALLDRFTQGK